MRAYTIFHTSYSYVLLNNIHAYTCRQTHTHTQTHTQTHTHIQTYTQRDSQRDTHTHFRTPALIFALLDAIIHHALSPATCYRLAYSSVGVVVVLPVVTLVISNSQNLGRPAPAVAYSCGLVINDTCWCRPMVVARLDHTVGLRDR